MTFVTRKHREPKVRVGGRHTTCCGSAWIMITSLVRSNGNRRKRTEYPTDDCHVLSQSAPIDKIVFAFADVVVRADLPDRKTNLIASCMTPCSVGIVLDVTTAV